MPFKPLVFDPKKIEINDDSPLSLKQTLFAWCVGQLLVWVYTELRGVRLTFGEGHVAVTDAKDGDHDGPHRRDGGHYRATAIDFNLFILCTAGNPSGEYVTSSDHPMWKIIGDKFTSLHPLCRAGYKWGDANHLSVMHNGVA